MKKIGMLLAVMLAAMFIGGAALAEEYMLNYEFEGELPTGLSNSNMSVEAGTSVTLFIPVGEVFENQQTGKRTRLESWTETVPEGETAVEFTVAKDEFGNDQYSFAMPERDVTVVGRYQKVYAVVYDDGEEAELFPREWHAVAPGEATPDYNGGKTPEREGYIFKEWTPERAATVTEDVEYAAVWIAEEKTVDVDVYVENEEPASSAVWTPDDAASDVGVEMHIELELDNFTGEVYVNDELVDEENYEVTEGSTVITFTPEYLATLPEGRHEVSVVFKDAESNGKVFVNTEFSVAKALPADIPQTGDSSNPLLWAALMAVSAAAAVVLTGKRSRA